MKLYMWVLPGFTQKFHVNELVYYEIHQNVCEAITREKQIKRWKRQWKINLNPQWINLTNGVF